MVRQAHHDRPALSLPKGNLLRLLPPNQVRGRNDSFRDVNLFRAFIIIQFSSTFLAMVVWGI